jgi:hypothetical protein
MLNSLKQLTANYVMSQHNAQIYLPTFILRMHRSLLDLGNVANVMLSMDKDTLIAILTGLALALSFVMGYLVNGFTA